MYDVIVVGAGIMGATISEAFKKVQSRDVLVIDDKRSMAGTPPSGGSVTPSKLTGLGDDLVNPVLDTLDSLWGLRKENFVVKPSMGLLKYDVYQTDMGAILDVPKTLGKVTEVKKRGKFPQVIYGDGEDMRTLMARKVVVCAGAFCDALFPEVFGNELTAKVGVSFRWHGKIKQAFAMQWRPYLKIFAHPIHIGNDKWETWGCDGSAIVYKNWTEDRIPDSRERVRKAIGTKEQPYVTQVGLRPFFKDHKPCYLDELDEGVWVATGAGKFGSIAAGWAANELLRRA